MEGRGRPSLVDIAREAGVSVSTASRALNRPEMVRPEVAARVRQVADRLGYSPNPFARSLRLQTSRTIGLVVPDNRDPLSNDIADGIEAAASNAGYILFRCSATRPGQRGLDLGRVLLQQRVAGVLLLRPGPRTLAAVETLHDEAVPVVAVEGLLNGADSVRVDWQSAMRAVVSHLAGLGHRTLAYLATEQDEATRSVRLETLRDEARAAGIELRSRWATAGPASFASGHHSAARILGGATRPTAIMCGSDQLAIGAISGAAALALRVPADVSIVGFGDTEMGAYAGPPLTTVAYRSDVLARLAVQVLLRRTRRSEDGRAGLEKLVATRLTIRQSTGPAPVQNADPAVVERADQAADAAGMWGLR